MRYPSCTRILIFSPHYNSTLLLKSRMSSPQDSMDKVEAKPQKGTIFPAKNELPILHAKFQTIPFFKTPRFLKGVQITLRLVTIVATFTATLCMLTSHQSTMILGMQLDARYSYSPAFTFFVYANAIACFFILVAFSAAIFFYLRGTCPSRCCYYMFFLNDMMMLTLMIAGCAAATAIGDVGLHGNSHTGWASICGYFGKFCGRVTISLTFSYVSVVSLFIVTLISAMNFKEILV